MRSHPCRQLPCALHIVHQLGHNGSNPFLNDCQRERPASTLAAALGPAGRCRCACCRLRLSSQGVAVLLRALPCQQGFS